MVINIILGVNIDTLGWINKLKLKKEEYIVVLDYEYIGEPEDRNGILYMSIFDLKTYIVDFDNIFFYKSMYRYPGAR